MAEKEKVVGEEALKRMARRALGESSSSSSESEEDKNPLKRAQKFKEEMAAGAIIDAEVEKAQAGAAKVKAEARRAESGESEKREPESGIKMKGEFDIGKFNIQEQMMTQQAELKELKKEAENQAGRQAAISDDLRERLHAKEMEVLKTSFEAQMQMLSKMIESNASRGSFMEQYQASINIAKELGFSQPQLTGDLTAQIELKKLDYENTRELRRLTREEKDADKRWQLEIRRLDDERDARKVEQTRQEKRDDMFAKAPAVLGGAIAKGILESGGEGEAPVASKAKAYHVEAGEGDSGEIECPGCSQPVGIGPTARVAVCANCGTKMSIKRTEGKPPEGEE